MPQRQLQQIPQTPQAAQKTQEMTRRGSVGCGILWLVFVSAIALPGFLHMGFFGWFMFLFMIPFFAVGIGLIVWGLAPTLRALKVSPPEIDVSSDAVRLGESFDVSYRQTFKAPLDVDFVKFTFVMRETAIYRRGTDTYTEKHEIPIAKEGQPGRTYKAGEELSLHYRFVVPKDGMHTFVGNNNRIEWLIKVHVSIARWPDVQEEYPVRVLAERYADLAPETFRSNNREDR